MNKIVRLNYTITVSDFGKPPLVILAKMLSKIFENLMSTESFSVASYAAPINIFRRNYSNLQHLNKCNGTAI